MALAHAAESAPADRAEPAALFPFIFLHNVEHDLWGSAYRPVHGWIVFSKTDRPVVVVAQRAIIGFTILVLEVGVPLRAVQMESFTRPFAEANRYFHSLQTDVVQVDVGRVWFSSTVIRNDPVLADRPLDMSFLYLTPDQLRQVCRSYSMTVIEDKELARPGVVMADRDYSFSGDDEVLRQIANGPTCRRG